MWWRTLSWPLTSFAGGEYIWRDDVHLVCARFYDRMLRHCLHHLSHICGPDTAAHFDRLWFTLIVAVNLRISFITDTFGYVRFERKEGKVHGHLLAQHL